MKQQQQPVKEIHDNVWGSIRLTQPEVDILNHPLLQRLRRISQLGLVSMVYPAAGHSRLAHSLGVLALASRVSQHLLEIGDLTREESVLLRVSALVHDVGHYPLSHSTEEFYTRLEKGRKNSEAKHEAVGKRIICETELKELVEKALDGRWKAKDVGEIIQGRQPEDVEKPAIWQLINSQFDLDRMDYLFRDSIAVGLDYGRIDFTRIISNLVIDQDTHNLGVNVKASAAVENYVLARYYLWDVVYLHKTVMGFEILQEEACKCLHDNNLFPSFEQVLKMIDDESFLQFDDAFFWSKLYEGMKQDGRIEIIGRMLRDRVPLSLAYEVPTSRDILRSSQTSHINDALGKAVPYAEDEEMIGRMCGAASIPREWCFPRRVDIGIHEFLPVIEGEFYDEEFRAQQDRARESIAKTIRLFRVRGAKKEFVGYLAMNPLSIVSRLHDFKKTRFRFYTTREYRQNLADYLSSKFE